MDIYLAGEHEVKNGNLATEKGHKILESFYYAKDNPTIQKIIPHLGGFLLDSGAFSFMQGKEHTNWDKYTEEYAEFINANKVNLFFELDIDSIVGLKEVERLRAKLERLTGKQPIPVWHPTRTKEYWLENMCGEYPYVAIGSTTANNIPREKHEAAFPWFISTAHKAGCKIHGLGYTSIEGMKRFHFDSVDSTAWLYGNRGGFLYRFNYSKGAMDKINAPSGCRLKSRDAALWNFKEWIKFQQYAQKHL